MSCCETVTYRKSIPSEIITKGDLIMIDSSTGYVRKAFVEKPFEYRINSSLVIGVCVWSDNDTPIEITIDGGSSKDVDRDTLDSGTSKNEQTILIAGGDSNLSGREIIKIAYIGEQVVNICGYSHIGDKLCISNIPGKAKALDVLDDNPIMIRSIGKIIGYVDEEKTQAKVLLDIE